MRNVRALAAIGIVAGMVLIGGACAIAAAQEAVNPVVVVQEPTLIQQITPILLGLAGLVITICTPIAVAFARKKWGEEAAMAVEQTSNLLQQRLQGAVGRAAGLAINDLGVKAVTDAISTASPAVSKGVDYLRETMGGTLAELGLNNQKGEALLRKMIVAHIGEKTASSLGGQLTDAIVFTGGGGETPAKPGR